MTKLAITTLATAVLATVLAVPAWAQPPHLSGANRGYGEFDDWGIRKDPYEVIGPRGTVKGRDPDPFIRWSIHRGYWADNSTD